MKFQCLICLTCCCTFHLISKVDCTNLTSIGFLENLWEHVLNISDSSLMTETQFKSLLIKLKIGQSMSGAPSQDNDHDHEHRRKKRSTHEHDHEHESEEYEKCVNGEELFSLDHKEEPKGISKEQFKNISPALIQQILLGKCNKKQENSSGQTNPYLWGSLSITVISALPLCGVVVLIWRKSNIYQYVMLGIIKMAIGVMLGDVVLHLLPLIIMGSHQHKKGEFPIETKRLCLVLGVLFALHLLDSLSDLFSVHVHDHNCNDYEVTKNVNLTAACNKAYVVSGSEENVPAALTKEEEVAQIEMQGEMEEKPAMGLLYILSKPKLWMTGPYRVVLLIVVGDALHNLADGLAVGAAFTKSNKDGLMLSLAVAMHELPHELADFVVLLSAGLTVPAALCLNILSALTAFAGLYIGIPLSLHSENVQLWILTITAAMFLYISLVSLTNMAKEYQKHSNKKTFFFSNIGFLIGLMCNVLIMIFEVYQVSS